MCVRLHYSHNGCGDRGNMCFHPFIHIHHRTIRKRARSSLYIVTLYSQYMYSLILYAVSNKHLFDTNNEIHKYKTRNNNNLHIPIANLSKFNKGVHIWGIKVFNHLPQHIKALTNDQKCFKSTLKRSLYHHSFYSMNEYYEYKGDITV
jgi:hypothetical protein